MAQEIKVGIDLKLVSELKYTPAPDVPGARVNPTWGEITRTITKA